MPRQRRSPEFERVRNLVALDAAAVMARVEAHRDEMITLFSRHRDREPLLTPLRSLRSGAGFDDLSHLEPPQQTAVVGFYEELAALRWYFTYTDDMPGTAQRVFEQRHHRLCEAYARMVSALGAAAPSAPGKRPARKRRKR